MSYCINPKCTNRLNLDDSTLCQGCQTPLLINNRYRLIKPLRELDDCGSTEIFEVADGSSRKVLKVLKRPKLKEMFEREVRVLQQLHRPGIPQVDKDGFFTINTTLKSKELYCFVMEKIEGKTLDDWLKKYGKIPEKIALDWLRQLTEIIQVLHENSLFHRDIKPSNCIVKTDGNLALIDFGSVRDISATYLAKIGSDRELTSIISSGYSPPEQATGRAVPQSDFFALGRTFVHLLTEKHPVDLQEDPKTGKLIWKPLATHISSGLATLIDDLIAPLPAKRPVNAQVILHRLDLIQKYKIIPLNFEHFSPLAGYLGLFCLSVFGSFLFQNSVSNYYYQKGLENHVLGETFRAETMYQKALEINPNSPDVYNALGFLCQQEKKIECARKAYEKAISLNPKLGIAHFNLGSLCEDRQEWECAYQSYQAASKIGLITANNNLARLYILKGDYQQAEKQILPALKKVTEPTIKYALLKNLGWAYLGQQRYQEAAKILDEAVKENNQSAGAYCLLAQTLEAQKQASQLQWENCLRYASVYNQDEAVWIDMARQRLTPVAEEP